MGFPIEWINKIEPRRPKKADLNEITVPLPPTTNNLFINVPGRGRVKSPKYREWCEEVSSEFERLAVQTLFPVEVKITICGGKGFRSDSDIANREKGIIDAIVAAEKIPDDSWQYVQRVIIEYQHPVNKKSVACAIVRISPM